MSERSDRKRIYPENLATESWKISDEQIAALEARGLPLMDQIRRRVREAMIQEIALQAAQPHRGAKRNKDMAKNGVYPRMRVQLHSVAWVTDPVNITCRIKTDDE